MVGNATNVWVVTRKGKTVSVKNVICGFIGWVKGWMVDKPEFVFLEGVKKGATVEFGTHSHYVTGLVTKVWKRGVWLENKYNPGNPEFFLWRELILSGVRVINPSNKKG